MEGEPVSSNFILYFWLQELNLQLIKEIKIKKTGFFLSHLGYTMRINLGLTAW